MTANVTTLNGGPVVDGRTPNEFVVHLLRETLAAAEAGEIVGIALAKTYFDRSNACALAGMACSYGMVGAIETIKAEVMQDILNG